MKVYLLWEMYDSYDNYEKTVVDIFSTREGAERELERINLEALKALKEYIEFEELEYPRKISIEELEKRYNDWTDKYQEYYGKLNTQTPEDGNPFNSSWSYRIQEKEVKE